MRKNKVQKLKNKKKKVVEQLPPLSEVIRGTFIECYLQCIRENCSCHKDKKYRHGPYYRISYGKKGRMYHVYVPLHLKETVKRWTKNYEKIREGIEKISDLNIKLIRSGMDK
jgi:hypothetical protein